MADPMLFASADYVRTVLQGRLPGLSQGDSQIADCQPLHLHYKTYLKEKSRTRGFLSGAYRLDICNRARETRDSQIIFIKAYQGERSGAELKQFLNQRLYPVASGIPLTHLPDLDALVWTFPNDPVMYWLPEAITPPLVQQHLRSVLQPQDSKYPVIVTAVEIINYRPEIRCTTKYQLRCDDQPHSLTLYGKTYADNRGREIFARIEKLWQLSQSQPDRFLIPRPVGYCEAIRTFWQEELPGIPLVEFINETNYRELLDAAVQRLVFLNHCALEVPPRFSLHEQLTETKKKVKKLIHAFPALQFSLQSLLARLEEQLSALAPVPERLVHGDFHVRQLMVHQGQVALFDFDESGYGDPVEDLGHFIADLLETSFAPAFIQKMSAAVIQSYSRQSGWIVPADRLNWHLSVQLVAKAYRAFLQQKPQAQQLIERFIALTETEFSPFNHDQRRRQL